MTPARTITIRQESPWLLGWCRWSIETVADTLPKHVLASGRWRWRGRHAEPWAAEVSADKYWRGA